MRTLSTPRLVLAVAVVVSALVLQVGVLGRLSLPGATPDVVLLGVVSLALVYGSTFGAVTGFAAGLALDLVPPADHAAGRWALVLTLVGYLCGQARAEVERSALVPFLVVGAAAGAGTLLYALLGVVMGDARVTWLLVARVLPTAVLYDLVLAPFVVPAVLALARRAEPDLVR
ncbi:MAG: rod shape-determining protein MreD [Motilibacteraceae bacterium]